MMKYYDLGITFMGHDLYIRKESGVYGENERQNDLHAEYIKKQFEEFMKRVVPDWVQRVS